MEPKFGHDPGQGLFTAEVGDVAATLLYAQLNETTVDFQSTFVPDALRNQYFGTRLVRYALGWARDHNLKVVPSCWFVKMVIEKEPHWKALLATESPPPR